MFIAVLTLCAVEFWNLTGMSIMIVLMSLVEKRRHSLLYPIFGYASYVLCCVLIYLGIDKFLKDFLNRLISAHGELIGIGELIVGALCIAGFVVTLVYIIRYFRGKADVSPKRTREIKSVRPVFIVLLAVTDTLVNMPLSVPVLSLMGIMASENTPVASAVLYISLFCLIPMILPVGVYILAILLKRAQFDKFLALIKKLFIYCCIVMLPIILILGAVWGVYNGLTDILPYI